MTRWCAAFGAFAAVSSGCGEAHVTPGVTGEFLQEKALVWGSEQRLVASDSAELDQFGYAVSLAGDRALVGAYGESLYGGAVYAFRRDGAFWLDEQKLLASDGAEGDSFGWSVSLDGDRLLVGAYAHDSHRGAAYVFRRNGDSWLEEHKLVASDGAEGDSFGWSVALFEGRALVGAFAREDSRGAAYVFASSDGAWTEEARLVLNEAEKGDMFGYAVSLSARGALIGAPGSSEGRGSAHVFTESHGLWSEGVELTAGDGVEDDRLGISVSLAGDRALAGAYSGDSLRGAAYVFSVSDGVWSEEEKLVASDSAAGFRVGNAVALGPDVAVVGAFGADYGRGAAYVFARADGDWIEQQKLVASDGATGDFFGWAVALDGPRVLVGANYDDVLRGAAYVLSRPETAVALADPTNGCSVVGRATRAGEWPLGALGVLVFARRRRSGRWRAPSRGVALLAVLFAFGCAENESDPRFAMIGGVSGSAGSGWDTGGSGGGTSDCVGTHVVTSKRVVRLTEHQVHNSYAALFGEEAAATIAEDEDRPSPMDREFPPISGDVSVSEGLFAKYERLAQAAMRYVASNAGTLTSCGERPNDAACVRAFLQAFAEKAFRRPLDADEESALFVRLWDELTGEGATVAQALAYGVYAILSSPGFVYRTELGSDPALDGPLTAYERATALSMFLTDGPPDEELLEAARTNQLDTPEHVAVQAARLLETDAARRNLELALLNYFSLANAGTVILNPQATPGLTLTSGLQATIVRESELFLKNLLWSGPLAGLLTAQRTWTTGDVAASIYGVEAPAEVDADGFGLVELTPDRSGLFTLSAFLLSGARSTGSSPVARGLNVNASLVCAVNQPFPQVVDPETGRLERDPAVTAAIDGLAGQSELEKARYRASTPRCAGCHLEFDAFGMVLEPYDAAGRFRTADPQGRPIDESWTTTVLPESVGAAPVTNLAEAARAIAESGVLERCMALNFINYALTEVSKGGADNTDLGRAPRTGSCAVKNVIDRFEATDRSFSSLMREIAASETLSLRAKGL